MSTVEKSQGSQFNLKSLEPSIAIDWSKMPRPL